MPFCCPGGRCFPRIAVVGAVKGGQGRGLPATNPGPPEKHGSVRKGNRFVPKRSSKLFRHFDTKEPGCVACFGLFDIVTLRYFEYRFEVAEFNFPYQVRRSGMITGIRMRAITMDANAPTLHRHLQILLPRSCQFDQNGHSGIGYENICVRNPPPWLLLRLTTHVHNISKNVGSASIRRPLAKSFSSKSGGSVKQTCARDIRTERRDATLTSLAEGNPCHRQHFPQRRITSRVFSTLTRGGNASLSYSM